MKLLTKLTNMIVKVQFTQIDHQSRQSLFKLVELCNCTQLELFIMISFPSITAFRA